MSVLTALNVFGIVFSSAVLFWLLRSFVGLIVWFLFYPIPRQPKGTYGPAHLLPVHPNYGPYSHQHMKGKHKHRKWEENCRAYKAHKEAEFKAKGYTFFDPEANRKPLIQTPWNDWINKHLG